MKKIHLPGDVVSSVLLAAARAISSEEDAEHEHKRQDERSSRSAVSVLRLGNGLREIRQEEEVERGRHYSTSFLRNRRSTKESVVIATKCGRLRTRDVPRHKNSQEGMMMTRRGWMDNEQRRYVPVINDEIVGIVTERHGEEYKVRKLLDLLVSLLM